MTNQKNHVLRVMHINDTHSYFDESVIALHSDQGEKCYVKCGGFSRVYQQISLLRQEIKAQGGNSLFFHAGDCFQGSLYFSLYKGAANADLLNQFPLDGMVLGNHEFDLSNELVSHFINQTDFPILMGNWDLSQENPKKELRLKNHPRILDYDPILGIAKYTIKSIENTNIAIFGLTTDQMDVLASPDEDTPFVNAIQTAQQTVEHLSAQGINNVIIVSHLGYEGDKLLAKSVNGVDLIIGGHTHILQGDYRYLGLEKASDYGELINGTYIVQAGCHALAVGYCDLEYSSQGELVSFNGHNILLLDQSIYNNKACSEKASDCLSAKMTAQINSSPLSRFCQQDANIEALLIDKYRNEVAQLSKKVIGHCLEDLSHRRIPDEKGQSEVAPWVAEAFYYKAHQLDNRVQFGLHNAGGVRSGLHQGEITYADIAGKVLPFAIPIVIYSIKGKYLKAAIEGAIDNATDNGVIGSGSGSFPYVARIRYRYDASRIRGQRIVKFDIYHSETGWSQIADEQVYTGTSSVYTTKGKEGYDPLLNREPGCVITNASMADCLIDYLSHSTNLSKPKECLNQYQR